MPPPPHSDAVTDSESPLDLLQSVRQRLVQSQLTVLELNDRILEKETDKADAVALLGFAELQLENKINHHMELDRVLNIRIQELETEVKSGHVDRATLSDHVLKLQTEVKQLVEKIDTTNLELGQIHETAGQFAQELAEAKDSTLILKRQLEEREGQVQNLTSELEIRESREIKRDAKIQSLETELNAVRASHIEAKTALSTLRNSWIWKFSKPLRRVFGPAE